MANAVPLTTNEELNLMKRFFASRGLPIAEASQLANRAITDKAARQRWTELQKQFRTLKVEAQKNKLANRSNREAKGLLRNLTTAVSMFELYKAQSKYPSDCNVGGEFHRLFNKQGYLTKHEQIALMSGSTQSALQRFSVGTVQNLRLADDDSLCRAAGRFCKRFGLKV